MTPAVVVIAYDRPASLERLLRSMASAVYPAEHVQLVISIDQGDSGTNRDVVRLAEDFAWKFGHKRVLEREKRLGLVEHFRACGRFSSEYGAVVLLEDDLVAGPAYYAFARQVSDFYAGDARIAGACLYGLWFNGFTGNAGVSGEPEAAPIVPAFRARRVVPGHGLVHGGRGPLLCVPSVIPGDRLGRCRRALHRANIVAADRRADGVARLPAACP
jgi:hypothetical protein